MTSMDERGPDGAADDGGDEVARYAAAVRAELADLPAAAVADLLEDLEDHLREVAAEDVGDLTERLGTPARYAAELRASAGLPEPGPAAAGAPEGARRISLRDLVAAAERRLRAQWLGREVLDFLPQLRPAWWIVRAWLVVYVLQLFTGGDSNSAVRIIPRPGGSAFLGLLLLCLAIGTSVWLARRPPFQGRRAKLMAVAQFGLGIVAFAAVINSAGDQGFYGGKAPMVGYAGPGGLNDTGRPITNLYVYDQNGKLLQGVYVYDQNGQPVQVDQADLGVSTSQTYVDADGVFVFNRYPEQQNRMVYDAYGNSSMAPVTPPSVIVPTGVHLEQGPGAVDPGAGPVPAPSSPVPPVPTSTTSTATPSDGATPTDPATPATPATPQTPATPSTSSGRS